MKRIVALMAVVITLVACENETEKKHVVYDGIVEEKYFAKGQTSTGVGMSMNGQMVVTQSSTSDEYILFIDGEDYTVDKDEWISVEKGERVYYVKKWYGIDLVEEELTYD